MTIRDAMPTAALHHAAACLKEVGYVPRQPRRLFGPSEPQSARAARLGAEVQAFINWVFDMWDASRGVSTAAPVSANDASIALHLALDGADLLDATDTAEVDTAEVSAAARRAWAADPGYVSELMEAAWIKLAADAIRDAMDRKIDFDPTVLRAAEILAAYDNKYAELPAAYQAACGR